MGNFRQWFDWYCQQLQKEKQWPSYRNRFLCPCCYMPTLLERRGWEICPICFWEDDGQDTDDANVVRGGPNHDYSLIEARKNFEKHHTMYRPADSAHFEREQSRMPVKKKLYEAFCRAIESDKEDDWKKAMQTEIWFREQSEEGTVEDDT